jgi:transposase
VIQALVAPQVIDKGIPTAALLAWILIAKYVDHLYLYRQEPIFARAGFAIPQSTLGAWVGACGVHLQPLVDALHAEMLGQAVLHADETPVQMLSPGKGKTHRAYLWAYTAAPSLHDFANSRAGEHARAFLGAWRGKLVCDDYRGYKARFHEGINEIGCAAHACRKFFDRRNCRTDFILCLIKKPEREQKGRDSCEPSAADPATSTMCETTQSLAVM